MSEYDDGGAYDSGQQHYEHGDADYGQEQQHDLQYGAVAESEAAHHDVNYDHGHEVEYDTPGSHYQEADFTDFNQHDDQSANLQAAELAEHDASAAFGDESLTEFDAQHADAFFTEHGLPAPEHMELGSPEHMQLPADPGQGGEAAHTGTPSQTANPYAGS